MYKVDSINSASPKIDLATDVSTSILSLQTKSIEKELDELETHQLLNIGQIDLVSDNGDTLSSLVVHVKKDSQGKLIKTILNIEANG